ncbi:Phytosulfokine [Artemisia annua]|uniref:Phytosulfokine n=1 Tax=Artemisia annua TaxID=35608 RepID=A0A2U1L177_ARTAN|nr:Phytosulfokine [Artemisia annua]
MKFDIAPKDLYQVLDVISASHINKSIWSVIQRLVLGAVVYVIWQERNLRIFQGKSRNEDVTCGIIKELVRFKLMSLKLKGSVQTLKAAEIWNFHVTKRNAVNSEYLVNKGCMDFHALWSVHPSPLIGFIDYMGSYVMKVDFSLKWCDGLLVLKYFGILRSPK